jgi:uncharacterized protein
MAAPSHETDKMEVRVMHYVVLLEDNPERADMRQKHMAEHLAFLAQNAATIRAAGPLKDTADGAAAGGFWHVEADNPQAVKALYEADPFWPTGLRKSVRVLEWKQVIADGKVLA